jgi:hypothetical protein
MKLYEISNPSDPYTIRAEFKIAAAAVLLLGQGKMGIHTDSGEDEEMPLFIFGGHEEWLKKQGMDPLDEFIKAHLLEIADALDTVLIGSYRNRATFEKVIENIKDPEERQKARATYHDEKRSSLNDIGGSGVEVRGSSPQASGGVEE